MTALLRILCLPACLLFAAGAFARTDENGCQSFDGGIIRGPAEEKKIALVFTGHTFAEGGPDILDALDRHHAKASFFLTGDFLTNEDFAPLVRRMVAGRHYVGPHSDKHLLFCDWDNPDKTLVTRDEFRADLTANLDQLERLGVRRDEVRYFLPAFEHFDQDITTWSAELGLTLVNFTPGTRANADYTGEGDHNFVSSQRIFDSILARERAGPDGLNGFILLLHLGSGPGRTDKFSSHFGALLDVLAARGYEFVRIDTLVDAQRQIHLRVNQTGYGRHEPKSGIAFSRSLPADRFAVVNAATGKEVFTGETRPITNAVWGQFTNHAELDFSAMQMPGHYFLRCGGAVSLPFEIGDHPAAALPDELLVFMREQRCGYNPWLGTNCHQLDGRTAYGPLPAGTAIDATGGWHDAGDMLKYLLTSGNATAQMLLAYELAAQPARRPEDGAALRHSPGFANGQSTSSDDPRFSAGARKTAPGAGALPRPARDGAFFGDHVDALGNPGTNGLPDILDEARWGLDWMLKLHPAPDQLYHQVADDRDHAGFRLPQDDPVDYGWGKGGARVVYFADGKPQGLRKYQSESTGVANLAGRYAAAMALAYQIWGDKPQQAAYARRCLQAGREVYALGRAHEGVQQGNSYSAPYRYAETTWADDMEWGAAELFRATGEPHFLDEAKHYATLAADESWMGREQTGHYQYYPFMNAGHYRLYDLVDAGFKQQLAGYYRAGIERCVQAGGKNPYRIGVPFIWCSDNLVVALVTQCRMYERMTGDLRYHRFATAQYDWLLGRNPWGTTMFTEVGADYPTDVHLMTVQLLHRPVPGALVDGPVYDRIFQSLKGVAIAQPDPLAEFQGPAVYHNDHRDYSSNEPTMDGTASAILMFALENLDGE